MGGGCRDIVTGKSHAGPHWQHQLLMTNKGGGYDDSSQGGGCAENCASGYIASCLVKQLLLRGYTVKASVRDPAEDRLKLFKANLLEEGSYDSAVEGCEGVFHTASPFNHDVKDPEAELLDPAVKGTLNVLNSCANSSSIKRVVLTSIIAAVTYVQWETSNS
ncbi:hypothetical protein GOBAR_DD18599 [Gossypium barbadense]|nr:hypothetical protein GOBAR_DD18599 [Gossypium barbadense]